MPHNTHTDRADHLRPNGSAKPQVGIVEWASMRQPFLDQTVPIGKHASSVVTIELPPTLPPEMLPEILALRNLT